jgi:hypothetical protein
VTHQSYDDSVHEIGGLATVFPAAPAGVDSVAPMATAPAGESTPQRLAAIREQLKLLADYL